MRPVQIVTDGIANVPRAISSELDISIIPGRVFLKVRTYRDGVDLAPQAFCERVAESTEVPRTSQPPVGDFVQAYRRILDTKRGCEIVSIHIAGSPSGTVSSAWAAIKMLPDSESVEVIDTGQLSMGTGWVVLEAARMARTGATRTEVRCFVDELLTRVRMTAMIDNLENLYKGGRINQISTTLGAALQIESLLTIMDGRLIAWGRVRTHARALMRIASQVRS